jgi:hypothetical protein
MPDDFLIDHVGKMMRQTTMPAEIVEAIEPGSTGYTGRAMAIKIAGEEVIVMTRNLNSLDIVFNYIEAHLHKGNVNKMATLRTTACPEIVVVAKRAVTLDEEL